MFCIIENVKLKRKLGKLTVKIKHLEQEVEDLRERSEALAISGASRMRFKQDRREKDDKWKGHKPVGIKATKSIQGILVGNGHIINESGDALSPWLCDIYISDQVIFGRRDARTYILSATGDVLTKGYHSICHTNHTGTMGASTSYIGPEAFRKSKASVQSVAFDYEAKRLASAADEHAKAMLGIKQTKSDAEQ